MADPADNEPVAQGVGASPGAASGAIVIDADAAEELGRAGRDVILLKQEVGPDDMHGLIQARGFLTVLGGISSDAAVVARGLGKPYVAGCDDLSIDEALGLVVLGSAVLSVGDVITIDGGTGRVFVGAVPLVPPNS